VSAERLGGFEIDHCVPASHRHRLRPTSGRMPRTLECGDENIDRLDWQRVGCAVY